MAEQIWGEPRRGIRGANLRPIFAALLTFIALVAVALFVLTRNDDDGDTAADVTTTTTSSPSSTSSTTTITTTTTTTTTTIPTECTVDSAGTTTTTTSDTEEASPSPPVLTGSTLDESSSISTVGLDEVTFGMTVVQAETAANTRMIACEPVSDCYRVTPL